MASKAPKFIYTGIEVSGFDNSLRFYRDTLKMKSLFVASIKETGGRVTWLRSPGGVQLLELNWYPQRDWVSGSALDHLGFLVDDAADWQKRLIAAGGHEAPDAAVDAKDFLLRFAFDPDGVPLELIQPKQGKAPRSPKFIYTGIRVQDLAASAKFYVETFAMKNEGEGSAEWTNGKTVGLISPATKQRLELNWYPGSYTEAFRRGGSELDHLCFEVDDCDSWYARFASGGFKGVIAPFDEGSWRLGYVEGPDGECLEIGHRIKVSRKPRPRAKSKSRPRSKPKSRPKPKKARKKRRS